MHIMTAAGWTALNVRNVIPAPKDPTLLDQLGLSNRTPLAVEKYVDAIDMYLFGDHDNSLNAQAEMFAIMGNHGGR